MDLRLRDRTAIVGGASQGIGFGIARRLALEGARVAMLARREPLLLDAADRIRAETGASVVPVVADIRKAEDIRRAVEEAVKAFGTIHIVVNNDGAPPVGRLAGFDDTAWGRAVSRISCLSSAWCGRRRPICEPPAEVASSISRHCRRSSRWSASGSRWRRGPA
jgi:3-oxoacyl-[acyl-carrier protein] reductase